METSNNNSSLDQRIASWRFELSGGDMRNDEIDELQSHLEDSLNEFLANGLSESEAWLLAVQRTGPTEHLRKEFQKLEDSRANKIGRAHV